MPLFQFFFGTVRFFFDFLSPKGPPFKFFGTRRLFQKFNFTFFLENFSKNFFIFFKCLQRVPLNFFDILQQTGFSKSRKGPPCNRFKKCAFLSLGYSADFRRSSLVNFFIWGQMSKSGPKLGSFWAQLSLTSGSPSLTDREPSCLPQIFYNVTRLISIFRQRFSFSHVFCQLFLRYTWTSQKSFSIFTAANCLVVNADFRSWWRGLEKQGDVCSSLTLNRNKPGTAQVGAISKAQKDSKTTFSTTGDNKSSQKTKKWEKNFEFFLNFFFEVSGKSHSAEKCKRGDAFYLMLDALDALKMHYALLS